MLVKGTYSSFYWLQVAVLSVIFYWKQVYVKDNTGYGCLFYVIDFRGISNPCCRLWVPVLDRTNDIKVVPGIRFSFDLIRVPGLDNQLYLRSKAGRGVWGAHVEEILCEVLKHSSLPISALSAPIP